MNSIWGNYFTAMEPFIANDGHREHEQGRPDTQLQGLLVLAPGPTPRALGQGGVRSAGGVDRTVLVPCCLPFGVVIPGLDKYIHI